MDDRKISEWGETMIARVELMLRKGFYSNARKLIDQIEELGLDFNDKELDKITFKTNLSEVFSPRLANLLERYLGVLTVHDLLTVSQERLKAVPGIGSYNLAEVMKFACDFTARRGS
jgi:DNA-directed RNA polymerase alpha subunit